MAAEIFLSGAAEASLRKLASFVEEVNSRRWGFVGKLKKLNKQSTKIQPVLRDAEERQVREESVKLWLKDLQSVAYDAEHVLDEFDYEILRRKMEIENHMGKKVRNFFSISNPIAFRFKMAHKVKNINVSLTKITEEAERLKLISKMEPRDMTTDRREITSPFVNDDSEGVGRDDDISKKEEDVWSLNQNSEIWDSPQGTKEILRSLRLGVNNVQSSNLEQCFAYCSIFPKDFVIGKEDLIQLWMALGFLEPYQGRNLEMEDIGNNYFEILLGNSLFQDVKKNEYGHITSCKMSDPVSNLAQIISGSQSQCLTSTSTSKVMNGEIEARHISLIASGDIGPVISKDCAKKMRTLFLRNIRVLGNSLLNIRYLRVLKLYRADINELPTSIGKLIFLRYLDVSRTKIKSFPKSVGKLYNLQTLRLEDHVRHIELPNNLKGLISLRHIYFNEWQIESKQMPVGMGKLTCLQTLPVFFVGQERGRQIEELECLNKLRGKLKICNLEHVGSKEEAKKADLLGKTSVYELGFKWSRERRTGDNNDDEEVLEGLQPQPNLKSLEIEKFMGGKFPSWMLKMCSSSGQLVKIKLIKCDKCEQIPTLGQLPSLRILEIERMDNVKCIGREFYGCSGASDSGSETRALFPALKRLTLVHMENLVKWMEALEIPNCKVFPCLEKLSVGECFRLTTAPSHFSALRELDIISVDSMAVANICRNLTSLTSLSLESVSKLTFLPEGLLQHNKNLTSLRISNCRELMYIAPHVSDYCTSLRELYIRSCEKLCYLADGLHSLVSLEELRIDSCPNLESIPSVVGLTSLRQLWILGCEKLSYLPSGLQSCTSLETLEMSDCPNLISLPKDLLRELCSLSSLFVSKCRKLKCLPEGLHCLTRLKCLGIGGFWEELDSFPNFGQLHQQLRRLSLYGWPKLKSLPDQLQHLTALTSLDISGFDEMEALPEWLGNLSSLEVLYISDCKNLMYLPPVEAMRRLTKLQDLTVSSCPLLEERCVKDSGPEWHKISHIPYLHIFRH